MIRRYRTHMLIAALVAAAAFMIYCSGSSSVMQTASSSSQPTPSMGSVVVFGGDAPVCDVLSFVVTIQGATLTPAGGGTPVSVLAAGPATSLDFAKLMDFSTVLNFASVPTGEYSTLTLALGASPQLVVLDDTKSPPVTISIPASLSTATISIPIQPSLVVSSDSSAGLQIDFDLLKSVTTDANGQVTGQVHPVFVAVPSSASSANGLGEVEQLSGQVQSVSTASSNAAYTGSFTLTHADGTPPTTVYATSATQYHFEAAQVGGLSSLVAGIFVEVDAYVDASGNLVAKEVESEEMENSAEHKSAFLGLVTSVTRDAAGAVTQFTLFVSDEEPSESTMVPMKSTLTVNVADSTMFKITPDGVNEANLEFDPTTLGVGQAVVVHAQANAAGSAASPAPVTAKAIYLRLRSVVGNFKALLSAGSNGGGGAFSVTTCGSLFANQPITVITFADTAFAGVSGLSALTAQPTLVVKGLLFYVSQPMTVEGVPISAPGWVLEAKQVHQLNP
ncbi:MAG TPA: DUF4382 domain-containing protein [Terriglobia bacterium]|nr:DUF4382 domain-containing protein [Terriglobia bacterium]